MGLQTMTTSLTDRIDEWAIKTPQKVCYEYNGTTLSYLELKKQSDSLAFFLEKQALPKGAPIVVYGHMSAQIVVAFMACLKSGHAYVPVDTSMPKDRITQIVSASNPACLIAIEALPIETDKTIITANQITEIICENKDKMPHEGSQIKGDDTHYIIYTSGSTGLPKGVQISQNNLISFSNWLLQDFSLSEGLRILNQAPYSFDLSVMDLYPSLLSGSTLVPIDKTCSANLKDLYATIPKLQLDVWVSTPSFIDICLLDTHFNEENNPSLTKFIFCGEVLTKETARELIARFPSAKIYNTYGPTEATVAVTKIEITNEIIEAYPSLPLGKVKPDTHLVIMDQDTNELLPDGEKGEIVLIGPSVSKGYFNNEEKTIEAFSKVGEFMAYHTGDCGVMKDNQLFFQGRLDFQVKLHGYRIELEDIENNLKEVSYVRNAIVVPKLVEGKVDSLVAFVIPFENEFAKPFQLSKAIKQELATKMPSYMIPRKWVYKTDFLLTNNGKIDRKILSNEVNE